MNGFFSLGKQNKKVLKGLNFSSRVQSHSDEVLCARVFNGEGKMESEDEAINLLWCAFYYLVYSNVHAYKYIAFQYCCPF